MTRPLYKGATEQTDVSPDHANMGLWFDKFCDTWTVDNGLWTMSSDTPDRNPKLGWLSQITAGGSVGAGRQIRETAFRMIALAQTQGGQVTVFQTETRFVTGLGRSHPVENGFAWHPTLGTPYLPGSSIKGLVRAWAREQGETESTEEIDRLLGSRNQVGVLCFLDAIPTQPVSLEIDVMTPHYGGWTETKPPGDWRSPTPIPFLVTAPRTRFLFCIVPRGADGKSAIATAFEWLTSALQWAGAGAKTSVGYGYMAPDDGATASLQGEFEKLQQQRAERQRDAERRAELSPFEQALDRIAGDKKDLPRWQAWFQAVFDDKVWEQTPDDERGVLRRIREEMQTQGRWRSKSQKKQSSKDKDYQRTLRVMKRLEELGDE